MNVEIETGSLVLERLDFDSDIYGFEVGRITKVSGDVAALHLKAVEQARAAGFRHVSRRVLADDFREIAALEGAGYVLVDVGVVFDHDLREVARILPPGVRNATKADVEKITAECASIFRTSRFYHDPLFDPGRADEVHRRWIWSCFNGRADAILVLDDACAFVTCAVDREGLGNIALFGVAPSAQGKGVGHRLLRGALAWFAQNAKRIEVKTQAINYAAARMYERGGFRLCRSELTYACALGRQST